MQIKETKRHVLARCGFLITSILLFSVLVPLSNSAAENPQKNLAALVSVLNQIDDTQFQLDILRGMSEALKGQRSVPMPPGWESVEKKLSSSSNNEVRLLAQGLALTFGSKQALDQLRRTVQNEREDSATRRAALESLLTTRDPTLPPLLQSLLKDSNLRGTALRGLAGFDDPPTSEAILNIYPSLNGGEKRDALNTLASRAAFAKPLLDAVEKGNIPRTDLTADLVRQMRNLKAVAIDEQIQKVWGAFRETTADKQKEIQKYKAVYRAGGSTPGDAVRGRIVFSRICQQCHTLFDTGGKVGPDLTGSNRADLDYLLGNILDPNAVIPNDYRSSTISTKDDRVITGIIKKEDQNTLTIITANETVTIPRNEIDRVSQSEISMMPEGLLTPLSDQEVRDLIYYLGRPGQVPLLATPETIGNFFNGKDLSGWNGEESLWKVESGQIVGSSKIGLKRNDFLKSQMVLGDFRLICKVKLTPNKENSGIQFRTEPLPGGEVRGYQADVGEGWWGKLYEEGGRGLLWDKSGEQHLRPEDWNTYEVLAVGHKIRTALNGHVCVDLEDPKGALQGIIAFQLHAGGPLEVRYKDFEIELNPKLHLKTVQ
jgi:putative heme-binding domain-containing protein